MSPSTVGRVIPLEFMESGESGHVHEIDGAEPMVHRLSEMGISKGVAIQMIQAGSPCILGVGNHRLSLRIDETVQILVEVGA
jgi:ferrous iron transport protein A